MNKLVAMGVADRVEVKTTYRGSNSVSVDITVYTKVGQSQVNLSGSFVSESWIWH